MDEQELRVHGLVASGDGRVVIRMTRSGIDPEEVGAAVARAILFEGGGSDLDGFDPAAVAERRATASAPVPASDVVSADAETVAPSRE
jgi:hypothetical protein